MTLLGDDAVVNDNELVVLPRPVRMGVQVRGSPVGCPSGVGDTNMLGVDSLKVESLSLRQDLVLKLLHLPGGLDQLENMV